MAKHEKQTAVTEPTSEATAVVRFDITKESIAHTIRLHQAAFTARISLESDGGERHYEVAFTNSPMTGALYGGTLFYVRDVMVWQPAGTMSMGDMVKSVGVSDTGQLLLFKDKRRRMGTPKQIIAVGPLEDITVVIPDDLLR